MKTAKEIVGEPFFSENMPFFKETMRISSEKQNNEISSKSLEEFRNLLEKIRENKNDVIIDL